MPDEPETTVKTIATAVQPTDASLHDDRDRAMSGEPMTNVIAMLAALGVGGCSFISARRPPSPLPERGMVTCSDSYVAPIVDTVVTAMAVVALVVAARKVGLGTACDAEGGPCIGGGELVGVGVALASPFPISALYGYSTVFMCNEAKGTQARREVAENAAALADVQTLTNAAVLAARRGDCVTVKLLDAQVQRIDPELHETLFHDPAITQCLTAIKPPTASYCFAVTADDKTTTTCMASEAECHHALEMLPLGSATTTCVAKPP